MGILPPKEDCIVKARVSLSLCVEGVQHTLTGVDRVALKSPVAEDH
jgi:hypothetical protein